MEKIKKAIKWIGTDGLLHVKLSAMVLKGCPRGILFWHNL